MAGTEPQNRRPKGPGPQSLGAQSPRPLSLGPRQRRISAPMLAFLLSLGWLAAMVAVIAVLTRRGQGLGEVLGLVVIALAVFLPVAMIWLSVLVLRAVQALQETALRIEAGFERLRRADASRPDPEPQPAQLRTDEALALFVSRREANLAGRGREALPGQRGLALDAQPSAAPLGRDELVRALDFPRDGSDARGFDILRRALHDHATAELIRAAQEVLSGLSAAGIEMRDLTPDRARPEIWRAFAQGVRGPAVAALGGVREHAVLAQAAARMRADPGFRDTAHRFLRAFDRRLSAFEDGATDAQIAQLAETRSARAFMVLGRVTGMFG